MENKYTIITESTPFKLTEKVNAMLKNGYVCQGGVSMVYDDGGYLSLKLIYAQSMIKED